MTGSISKSQMMAGLQCPKRLWREVKQSSSQPMSLTQQHILAQGQEVGRYARQQFANGVLIGASTSEAISATQRAIASGSTCLFEAAFEFEGVFVRCDILQHVAAGWELIEVKSSSKPKDEHVWDVAIQTYVLRGLGLSVPAVKLMHLNTQTCCFPDLTDLFAIADVTADVEALLPEIPVYLTQFNQYLSESAEPTLAIGKHCDAPNPCPFKPDCWQSVPEPSIFTIPRLDWKKKQTLVAANILAIADLPADYPLTNLQRSYVDGVMTQQAMVDQEAIASSLAELNYPIHFFDFETHNPAIPRFAPLKPYAPFPFQYSCHILHADGSLEYRDYLHGDRSDPRPPLIAALLRDITAGSVVAYHKSFEASILRRLAQDFPGQAACLASISDRLWDLEDIFKYHYKHPGFRGSTSIKCVLPVLVPHLSYQDLAVQRGDQAQAVWDTMLSCSDEGSKAERMRDLRDYCRLDTLAMVEIYRALQALSVNSQ